MIHPYDGAPMSDRSNSDFQEGSNELDLSRRHFVAWIGSLPVLLHAVSPTAFAKNFANGIADKIRPGANYPYRPFIRWWWFSGNINLDDIRYQLDWIKLAGFSGVEIGFESNRFAVDYAFDRTNTG